MDGDHHHHSSTTKQAQPSTPWLEGGNWNSDQGIGEKMQEKYLQAKDDFKEVNQKAGFLDMTL